MAPALAFKTEARVAYLSFVCVRAGKQRGWCSIRTCTFGGKTCIERDGTVRCCNFDERRSLMCDIRCFHVVVYHARSALVLVLERLDVARFRDAQQRMAFAFRHRSRVGHILPMRFPLIHKCNRRLVRGIRIHPFFVGISRCDGWRDGAWPWTGLGRIVFIERDDGVGSRMVRLGPGVRRKSRC